MKQLQLHANYTFLLYETVLASCKLQLPCHPFLKFSMFSHFENDMTSLREREGGREGERERE